MACFVQIPDAVNLTGGNHCASVWSLFTYELRLAPQNSLQDF